MQYDQTHSITLQTLIERQRCHDGSLVGELRTVIRLFDVIGCDKFIVILNDCFPRYIANVQYMETWLCQWFLIKAKHRGKCAGNTSNC